MKKYKYILHHLAYDVPELEEKIDKLAAKGYRVAGTCSGGEGGRVFIIMEYKDKND